MARIVWRRTAVNDLNEIYDYIAESTLNRAESFVVELKDKVEFIAENPIIGEAKMPNHPAIRVFPYKRYILLFRPLDDEQGIEILRIIHGARDYQNGFVF